jgi:hypothetical protein
MWYNTSINKLNRKFKMAYPTNSWAILSASCLFNSNKVTLEQVMKEWNHGTILVCEKPNGSIGFIAGSQGDYGVKVGDSHACHHDQTLAKMGTWMVTNVIEYETVDSLTNSKGVLPFVATQKGTIAVFK